MRCAGCGKEIPEDEDLCEECDQALCAYYDW